MANEEIQKEPVKISKVRIFLGIAVGLVAFVLLFHVRDIKVVGNDYTPAGKITSSVKSGLLSGNSVCLYMKCRHSDYELPGSLDSVDVKLTNPWTVTVTVKEKAIVGCVRDGDEYIFFDKEGTVVLKSEEEREGIPEVSGANIKSDEMYKTLELKNNKMLDAMLCTVIQVANYKLTPDKIEVTDDGINLIFGGITVKLGMSVTTEKMAQISPILEKISGKTGVLHLEHYTDDSSTISFREEVVKLEEESTTDQETDSTDDWSSEDETYSDDEYYDDSDYDSDYYEDENYDENYDVDYQ